MKVGDKFKADGERCRFTVHACDGRFFVMSKPFNAQATYLYTIADLEEGVRGPCNLIFGVPCDVSTPDGAAEALEMLVAGEMEVSWRRRVVLSAAEAGQLCKS